MATAASISSSTVRIKPEIATPASSFLGSTRRFRLAHGKWSVSSSVSGARRADLGVVAVSSDVVKQKKDAGVKSSNSDLLITKEKGLMLLEDMYLGRAFEDMCAQMYYRGKMFGYVHRYNGQEAVSTGFIKLLKKEDSVVSTYRDHVHSLSKGVPARLVMAELFGKTTGCVKGQGGQCICFRKSLVCWEDLRLLVKGFQLLVVLRLLLDIRGRSRRRLIVTM